MTYQSFKEFMRRLRIEMPHPKEGSPFLLVEFESDNRRNFQSRIALYEFMKGEGVRYRYTGTEVRPMSDWSLRTNDYVILNIVPPRSCLITSAEGPLGIIQVGKRHVIR